MLSDLLFRARALLRRDAVDAELDDELREHLARLTQQHEAAGLAPDEAARLARMEFGGLDQVAASCRDARGVGFIDATVHDVRHAWRLLVRDAAFSGIAIVTLAVAIGASTVVFSVVNSVLLKPLSFEAADRIVLPLRMPPPGGEIGFDVIPWGRVDFLALAGTSRSFEHLGAFLGSSFNVVGTGEPLRVDGARVSAGFFRALGVAPELGRVFSDEADQPGRGLEVVLSHRLWRDRFASDPAVVGRAISLNAASYTVIGVMPAGFAFPQSAGLPDVLALPVESELWVPLALSRGPSVRGEPAELGVIGRLRPAVSLDASQAELDLFARQMDSQFPQGRGWFRSRVVPIAEQLSGGSRQGLLLLLGATGMLFLVACSNVANLLLARSISRAREMALRAALGAGRSRLVRQLATEHLLLGLFGCAGGVALAAICIQLLIAVGPANVPRLANTEIDVTVLVFTLAVSLVAALVFGLAPAWVAARFDLTTSLKRGGQSATGYANGSRLRDGLLVLEVALALVLVIASGLLVRTFDNLRQSDAGFVPAQALTFETTLPSSLYGDSELIVGFYRTALERLRTLPGVEAAGIGETVPMGGAGESTGLRIPDRVTAEGQPPPYANYTVVSPGYLAAAGTPLLQGRDFNDRDTATSIPVAIVNAAMARKYWPGQTAIGKQVGLPIRPYNMTVVGIVADVKHLSMREEPGPEIYVLYTQKPYPSMLTMHFVLRTKADPASTTAAARQAIHDVDPDVPLAAVETLETILNGAMAQTRFSIWLVGGFGAVSLLLACVGLYGAVSYAVGSRTKELGLRLALGASQRRILTLVLAHGLRVTVLGVVLGTAMALILMNAIGRFLYGINPTDPRTFGVVSLLLMAVALVTCYLPARRALRVDPVIAMRPE